MSTIKIKRSAVQGKIPLTTDLELGELAINTYDGKLYLKKDVGGTESIVDVSQGASASDMLSMIKTVDGAGSGLDADLLDGQHGSYYQNASNITTGTGAVALTATNGTLSLAATGSGVIAVSTGGVEHLRVTSSGDVGIGTTSPSEKLTVQDNADGLIIAGNFKNITNLSQNTATAIQLTADQAYSRITTLRDVYGDSATMTFGVTVSGVMTERMRISANGNVGIGTTTPAHMLHVNGSFAATTKSFLIDHPTKPDMKLRYGSLEGPENGVYIRGRSKSPIITLPEYWRALVDSESITVQLTPIGGAAYMYVKGILDGKVVVHNDGHEYYYMIVGERIDVPKLVVEFSNHDGEL